MPSTFASEKRRTPRQARATLRRAKFLEVAARLFGELGYEAVTMTMIAEQAQASIGTLYDYFPDKQTLALTLLAQYAEESDAHWTSLMSGESAPSKVKLPAMFVEGILRFVEDRPAYLPLLRAALIHTRTPDQRQALRLTIAKGLQTMNPNLPDDRAFLNAQVIVELIKGLLSVCRDVAPEERPAVAEEFKRLMSLYLADLV